MESTEQIELTSKLETDSWIDGGGGIEQNGRDSRTWTTMCLRDGVEY